MQKVQLLIIDENFDFGKSLSKIITDVFSELTVNVQHSHSIQEAVELVSSREFHFLFIRGYKENEKNDKARTILRQATSNKNARIITLSLGDDQFQKKKSGSFPIILSPEEEIIADELISTFEIMKDNYKHYQLTN